MFGKKITINEKSVKSNNLIDHSTKIFFKAVFLIEISIRRYEKIGKVSLFL